MVFSNKYGIDRDLYRYAGSTSFSAFLHCYLRCPGFKYLYWFRKAKYWRKRFDKCNLFFPVFIFFELVMRHYGYKYGMDIPSDTDIAPGFYIGHFGGIVIASGTTISPNVNISQCVTIGSNNGNYAVIDETVYIAPGVKIIGGIRIGSNVSIGANAVVVKDVEKNTTVAGIPAKIISRKGSIRYIQNPV